MSVVKFGRRVVKVEFEYVFRVDVRYVSVGIRDLIDKGFVC